RNTDILVSAGAGSGKTTVLVERVLGLITGSDSVDIDKLLIVTFTDAAAGHMRNSIAAALNANLKKSPRDPNLRRQLNLINKSNIMTIHSFCLMVARKFFHKIDMDPGFRVADTTEISLLKAEIMDELFEEHYQNHYTKSENETFVQLAQIFDSRVSDENFRKAVLAVHEYARSSANPQAWLDKCAEDYKLESGLENSLWYEYFVAQTRHKIDTILDEIDKALRISQNPALSPKYQEIFEKERVAAQGIKNALDENLAQLHKALEISFERLPGGKAKASEHHTEEEIKMMRGQIKDLRDSYKKSILEISKMLIKTPDAMLDDLKLGHKYIQLLTQMVAEFSGKFQEAKKERGIVDFGDFEHFCLNILVGEKSTTHNVILTPEAHEIAQDFAEIFIDEYQDSSMIQEWILSAVAAAGDARRFMVGDVKQCIYQFRLARPQIFKDKYDKFKNNDTIGRAISLADNYRSRQNVIDAVNFLFTRLMSSFVGGIDYENDGKLHFAAKFDNDVDDDFTAICHIVDKGKQDDDNLDDEAEALLAELSDAQAEAKIAAAHIKGLLQKSNFKKSDIVILLRSKTAAQVFASELKNSDIPAFNDNTDDYFLATEVITILSILQIIDNPRQEIPLITALFSDIFRLKADELVTLSKNRNNGGGDFYDAIINFSQNNFCELAQKINGFIQKLSKWRKSAGFLNVSELIMQIYHDTDYYNFVGILPGGKLRRANLMLLFEKAVRFDEGSFTGLFNFVRYIEKLQKANHNMPKASVHNENEDLVRIMTIHKSKGLEFPVVLLCQMGKKFNLMDSRKNLVLDYDLGIGLKVQDFERNISSNTFARAVIANRITNEQISEEMRIFYVALTRAKEKLILIGTAANTQKFSNLDGLPTPQDVLKGRSYMDWMLMTFGENAPKDIWDVKISHTSSILEEATAKQEKIAKIFEENAHAAQSSENSEMHDEIAHRLSYTYQHSDAMFAPAKMSVSEIKRLYFNEFLRESQGFEQKEPREFSPPAFIANNDKKTAAGRGIIIHTVLEHIDINKQTQKDITDLITQLVIINLLTEDEAKIVPIASILSFLGSDIANRMRVAERLYREIPFAMAMPASLVNSAFRDVYEQIIVHGVIDCIFEENGKLIIVDYKTGGGAENADAHRPQMELYKRAAEQIFGLGVVECALHFFDSKQTVYI
ncbi:MAG: helicase-exonuclease AddAB subunit AddA, partial [Defluviitaleaceae bacterium]|nr:helicase-exonuclease AddAB subunit AddA [Defluviitaleaceae bacterium]